MSKQIITGFESERQLQEVVDVLGDDWLDLLDNQGSPSERQKFEDTENYLTITSGFAIGTDYTCSGGGLYWTDGFSEDLELEFDGFKTISASEFLEANQ